MSGHRGELSRFSKLIEADVRAMRILYQDGWSPYFLSRVFQVSRPHAKRICRGEKWSWLK